MKEFSRSLIDELVVRARHSPRLRQHFNVHATYEDPCQILFNALEPQSYIRPHRHMLDPRKERILAIRGRFAAIKFDDVGAVLQVTHFSALSQGGDGAGVGVEVNPEDWHTVIAEEEGAVLLEIKAGPFDPAAAKEFASWAPGEGSAEAGAYLQQLRSRAFT